MIEQRKAVIEEAMTWLRTPWRHEAAVKGAGVDCGKIIVEVYVACGLIERPTIASYPHDWALHKDDERYLEVVEQYARRVNYPMMGDIVVYKYGRTFSHGGIVRAWPDIIHAKRPEGVILANGLGGQLANREHRFYSIWERG
ncbi:MAG: hypothetical protein M0R47_16885 [Methylobacter sp.]|uniref:hypothetical protein n=1 Tax=Methylobacter sp. TaxID=2051955 RepID=UPI0025E3FF36|nr:hypothetical protein [Methylobacter sp.]MCK9622199.1 hypothetical protein [Methylobacter sp.]